VANSPAGLCPGAQPGERLECKNDTKMCVVSCDEKPGTPAPGCQ
jgi:hypothetical protein